jgi:autotransporter translocation and assembly factor TamB
VSLSGTVDIQEMRETVVSLAISSNAIAADWSSGNIFWVTSTPSANFTVNLTNVPTDNDRVMTINVFVTQGATGYIPSALTINGGGSITPKWPTAAAPTPTSTAGRIDVFTFTLIRLSSAWTVLGSANLNWG